MSSTKVLIDRSEDFRLGEKERESWDNEVHVRHCSKEVLLLFLEYLYRVCDEALELFMLADLVYQVNGLSR